MGLFGKSATKTTATVREGWLAQCGPLCGFFLKNHDKDEAVEILKLHLKRSHKTNLTDAEAAAGLKPTTL